MAHNSRTDIWLGVVIAAITVFIVKTYQPDGASSVAGLEPAAGVEETIVTQPEGMPPIDQVAPTPSEENNIPKKENPEPAQPVTP